MNQSIKPGEQRMRTREQYRLGIRAYSAGRYEEAIAYLQPLTGGKRGVHNALPSRYYLAQAHYRMAVDLFEARQFDDATRHFQAAVRANPSGAGYARFLAVCHLENGRYDQAVHELRALLERNADDASTRIRLALAQFQQGSPTEAQATLREGLRLQPLNAELHYQLGVMQAAEDEMADAEKLFDRAVKLEPSHAGAYERLAQCCALSSRHERALRYLERAHHLEPANARIGLQLSMLAGAMIQAGRPVHVQWRVNHAARRPDAADLERLGEAILREPEFVEAFLSLPTTEVDEEVFSTLAAVLEAALRQHPEYADLHYHCGAVYRRLGANEAALRHAEKAVELNGQYIKALILLAELYGQTQRPAAAVERLEQAIQAGANLPDLHFLLGRLHQSGGQTDRAREAYQKALELNETYEAARQALVALAD
ncbi:MAG: hypothetical protein AMXMBFR13_27570 [Phycisphaerae bacterium]